MAETKLFLETPRKASGEPIYTLKDLVHAQFESVVLSDLENPDRTIRVISDQEADEVNVGTANFMFIAAMLAAVLSGRGDVPDGLCVFVDQNANKMEHLVKYQIKTVCSKRGGTYEAPFRFWLEAAKAKAQIIAPSLEKFPLPKRIRQKADAEHEPELVDEVL